MNIFLLRYVTSLVFGIYITASLANVLEKKNYRKLGAILFGILVLEGICYGCTDLAVTVTLYPLHSHIPLILCLVFIWGIRTYDAIIYVLLAYMYCQIPAWFSKLVMYAHPKTNLPECILYILMTILCGSFFNKFGKDFGKEMLGWSKKVDIALGIVPIIYYFFDYITTVWTNALYQGNFHVAQFITMVVSASYIIILCVLSTERAKIEKLARESAFLSSETAIVKSELLKLKETEQMAGIYQNQMKHHLAAIYELINEQNLTEAIRYIQDNLKSIEVITPYRFCSHSMCNLLLSYFANIAKQEQIEYSFEIELPSKQPFSDMELCALVSNALENAYHAVSELPQGARKVELRLKKIGAMLIFSVDNTCHKDYVLRGEMPRSTAGEEHGFGTRSIKMIAEKHQGVADFSASDGVFRLMVTIPILDIS